MSSSDSARGESGEINDRLWIHVLLKGERLADVDYAKQEQGEDDQYVTIFEANQMHALCIPILEFEFKNLTKLADLLLDATDRARQGLQEVGLVITSPRVVESIAQALGNKIDRLSVIKRERIFVVGPKTAQVCASKLGIICNETSTISGNSAALSGVIRSVVSGADKPVTLIYPKSSRADATIDEALANQSCLRLETIVTYDTRGIIDAQTYIGDALANHLNHLDLANSNHNQLVLNFVFFSPSGVECFFHANPNEMITHLGGAVACRTSMRCSCIGRTTEAALRSRNMDVLCVADRPSAQSLVDNIRLKMSSASGDQ